MVAPREARFYSALMRGLVRLLIRLYQWTLSPVLRLLCGPDCGCRFTPSCSRYFLEAVETHGVGYGSLLGLKRLARCQPWGGYGYDPVPLRYVGENQATDLARLAGCHPPASVKSADLRRV